jgi:hypothetical protein
VASETSTAETTTPPEREPASPWIGLLAPHVSSGPRQPCYLTTSPCPSTLVPSFSPRVPLRTTKLDHVSLRHLYLQALGSPKPPRPTPQVRALLKPASDVVLAAHGSQKARLVVIAWSGLFLSIISYLLYLASPSFSSSASHVQISLSF